MPELFALVKKNGSRVRRLNLISGLQKEAVALFERQRDSFFCAQDGTELPIHEFKLTWTGGGDEIFYLDEFSDPDTMLAISADPESQEAFSPEDDLPRLQGLFMVPEDSGEVLIQLVEPRRIFFPNRSLMGFFSGASKDTFQRSDLLGLQFDNKLTAVLKDGRVYFKSFFQANRVLGLSDYVVEAKIETVMDFLNSDRIEKFPGESIGDMAKKFTKIQQKKVAEVLANGWLETLSPEQWKKKAEAVDIEIELGPTGRIVIPEDKNKRMQLLQFLVNGFFESVVDGNIYVSNSKRLYKERSANEAAQA